MFSFKESVSANEMTFTANASRPGIGSAPTREARLSWFAGRDGSGTIYWHETVNVFDESQGERKETARYTFTFGRCTIKKVSTENDGEANPRPSRTFFEGVVGKSQKCEVSTKDRQSNTAFRVLGLHMHNGLTVTRSAEIKFGGQRELQTQTFRASDSHRVASANGPVKLVMEFIGQVSAPGLGGAGRRIAVLEVAFDSWDAMKVKEISTSNVTWTE